jgi:hypothetical protein
MSREGSHWASWPDLRFDADGLGFAAVAGADPDRLYIRQTTGHYTGALDVIAA